MIRISIIVGKTVVAQRSWSSVPNIGDQIEVGSGEPNKPTVLQVARNPLWKRDTDSSGNAMVDLVCTKTKR